MKLKDWDEEERNRKAANSRKQNMDAGDPEGAEESEPDRYEPGADTGQGLRRKKPGPEKDKDSAEELSPLPPWAKALIFIGLTVLAAILCAVLWQITHPDKPTEGNQGSLAQAGQPEEDTPDQSLEPDGQPASQPEDEAAGVPVSSAAPESESSAALDVEAPPEPENESAENGGTASNPQASAPPEASESQPTALPDSNQPQATAQPRAGDQESGSGNQESGSEAMGMTFTDVQESVMPKDAVNLRTMPTTTDDRNIVVKIQNGQALSRTGINADTGWSRIDYNGQILYAVSQYLTTDLNYKTPVAPTDPNRVTTADGTVVIFENCDDWITPKEYVNLRTEPSTLQEDATVSCQLHNGEKAHRTGFSADFGWSRVEYGGQVLYVVSSFVYTVPVE